MKISAALLLGTVAIGALLTGQLAATAAPAENAFATQARHAGLTTSQERTLQNRVNAYLTKEGGTQVAANEIRLPDGADLLLALPGEARARSLTASAESPAGAPCPGGLLCAYSAENYDGDMISATRCGFANLVNIPFASWGSWIYTKSTGNTGSFWNDGGRVGVTGNGPSSNIDYYWGDVDYMVACGV